MHLKNVYTVYSVQYAIERHTFEKIFRTKQKKNKIDSQSVCQRDMLRTNDTNFVERHSKQIDKFARKENEK